MDIREGRLMSYEPRCKVCTSPNRRLYEKLKSNEWTLKQIIEFARNQLDEEFSITSLSRHLARHTKEVKTPKEEIEVPEEPILNEHEVMRFLVYVFRDCSLDDVIKFHEEYKKLNNKPLFFTKSSFYEVTLRTIKNVIPHYLDTFKALWKEFLANPELLNKPPVEY